ncbi:MAG: arylesterase [Pseudomonadota bacterium]|nr:arylesterase [Pseudomonadota bacterium]
MLKKFLILLLLLLAPQLCFAKIILVLGDSLSAGYGIEVSKGWVTLLQQHIPKEWQVINASTSGDTTQNGLNKLPSLLTKHHPDIIIVELGGNDGLRGLSLTKMSNNLTKIIRLAKASGSKTLLVGVPMFPNYGEVFIKRFGQVYTQVAANENVPLISNVLANIADQQRFMQNDGIHPNQIAQEKILSNIMRELTPMLAQ